MAKLIKKQIKKSMPLFVIVSLLCANITFGIVFDLNISVDRVDNGVNITISSSETVQAQVNQNATTTVTVRNNPPDFNGFAAENPASASTSPVNMWASLNFTGTGDDPEGNGYYLIICSSNSVVASTTGGAPICGATTFCVSTSTVDNTQANCTYNNVQNPGAESQAWYAFVCDNHPTEGECNAIYSQGESGNENASPFWVNRPPFFTAVNTTVDNQNPDDPFTVVGTVVDPDTSFEADHVIMNVCATPDWATTTGCANGTFCTGTSTVGGDITCQFASTSPAMDGTYTYYAYVRDYHFLAATTTNTDTYTINNVAPVISGVTLHSGNDITLNIKNEAAVNATTSGIVSDLNGCTDIDYATGTVYWSGATGEYNCSPDDNDCYQIGQVDCSYVAGSCSGADVSSVYICSTALEFHAIPTTAGNGNPNAGTHWLGAVRGFDEALSGVGTSTVLVEVNMGNALNVADSQIPYGTLRGGEDTGAYNATTSIENWGNTPIDTAFSGTDMDRVGGGAYIEAYNQRYATSTFTYPGVTFTLSSTTPATQDLELLKPTSTSYTVFDDVYWGIEIPAGRISGVYEGSNLFTSYRDDDGW